MSARQRRAVGSIVLSLLVAAPALGETSIVEVELPEGARVRLEVPAEWQHEAERGDLSTTVRLSPREDGDFVVLLTVFPLPPESPVRDPEAFRAGVVALGESSLPSAVQSELELVEIAGEGVHGWLYHLTDRQRERGPGDYREAHQGMVRIGEHVASVTILTHSEDTVTVERAKQVLASAVPSTPP